MKHLVMACVVGLLGYATLKSVSAGGGRRAKAGRAIAKDGPDVSGVRLGMTYDQAKGALEKFAAKNGGRVQAVPAQPRSAAWMKYQGGDPSKNQPDSVSVRFTMGMPGIVTSVDRFKNGAIDENELMGALVAKYGKPSFTEDGGGRAQHYFTYSKNGRPFGFSDLPCKLVADRIASSAVDRSDDCAEIETSITVLFLHSPTAGVAQQFRIRIGSRSMNAYAQQAQMDWQSGMKQQQDQQASEAAKANKTGL